MTEPRAFRPKPRPKLEAKTIPPPKPASFMKPRLSNLLIRILPNQKYRLSGYPLLAIPSDGRKYSCRYEPCAKRRGSVTEPRAIASGIRTQLARGAFKDRSTFLS